MRKILLGIILIILIIFGINIVTSGIGIAEFKIQSLGQIEESSNSLKDKIEDVNKSIDTRYPKKLEELTTANNTMKKAKNEYLEYVNKSSKEQIIAARTLKSYAIEFLWMKLGTHAREEGINLTLQINSDGSSGGNTLNFTVDGSYIAITNFVYAIENDSDLDFRIQNFKLLPHEGEILEGTFTVSGITLDGELSTQSSISESIESSTEKEQNQNKTNEDKNQNASKDTNTVNGTNTVSE